MLRLGDLPRWLSLNSARWQTWVEDEESPNRFGDLPFSGRRAAFICSSGSQQSSDQQNGFGHLLAGLLWTSIAGTLG